MSGNWTQRKLHFIAIGGAGMSGLALVAHRLGASVTGSDRSESVYMARLRSAGLKPAVGHDAAAVPADAEVVVSTAIDEDNPELVQARERGQTVIHRGAFLAELCREGRLIAIAGTHGKTTTTGMVVHALRAVGADPTFFIGGELPGAGVDGAPANAGLGTGDIVVAEADESDASFLELQAEVAVVTNVELDHHARWGSKAELFDAFGRFASPAQGVALGASGDLDGLAAGASSRGARVERFDESSPGPSPLELRVPGRHNALNARAALAAIGLASGDMEAAAGALASFPGMVRRQELKGERSGALIYDDYAHHPTEVTATLAALRELKPGRLIAVFQPHLYSRTKALADDFGSALSSADEVGVLEIYAAREEPTGPLAGVSGLDVARATADHAGGKRVMWLEDRETAARVLPARLREGDLLVTIGAGDIFRLAEDLVAG